MSTLRNVNILVVDDSPELLEVFKYFLEHAGYNVISRLTLANIAEEIRDLKPGVILLDVILSGEDGREICRFLKNTPETMYLPIILMSANHKALEEYRACVADEILQKPFNLSEVIQKIESVLKLYTVRYSGSF